MEEIMLSIYIATYNHENYIANALDGVLKQDTKYTYEVLVGEDCSTDRTREILKEYETRYPGKFQMFYREHNMHNEKIRNAGDLKNRCRGKYIIALEGDDYWIDSQKLELQIRFLEENPEYIAVAHNCVVVGEDSKPSGEEYPECKDEDYTIQHFVNEIMPGQLTTVMYRNFYKDNSVDKSLCKKRLMVGDRCLYFTLLANGKVFCMQRIMSAYRHITTHGTSFSATNRFKYEDGVKLCLAYLEYANQIQKKQIIKYAEFMYMRNILIGLRDKDITWKEGYERVKKISKKRRAFLLCIKYFVNKQILKKEIPI